MGQGSLYCLQFQHQPSNMNAKLPPLHWLANRDLDGLNPSLWKLKKQGQVIPEHELTHPVYGAIRTIQGYYAPCILPIVAYTLLHDAAQNQSAGCNAEPMLAKQNLNLNFLTFQSVGGLPAVELLNMLPNLQLADVFGNSTGRTAMTPQLRLNVPPDLGFKRDWLLWSEKWMDGATRYVPQFKVALRDPCQLIRDSYSWLTATMVEDGLETAEFSAALTMLSLGVLGLTPRIECDLCFRLPIPQRLRCFEHNQTGLLHGNHPAQVSRQAQKYAEAKRACSFLDWPKNRPSPSLPITPRNEVNVVAGLLWPLTVEQGSRLNQVLNETLKNCPFVLEKLPINIFEIDAETKLYHLRTSLDPQEWNFEAWPAKLLLAEQWLAALKHVAPGRKLSGMSDKSIERLNLVKKLQQQGLSDSAIAKRLNISKSNLSHLQQRHAARIHSATQPPS